MQPSYHCSNFTANSPSPRHISLHTELMALSARVSLESPANHSPSDSQYPSNQDANPGGSEEGDVSPALHDIHKESHNRSRFISLMQPEPTLGSILPSRQLTVILYLNIVHSTCLFLRKYRSRNYLKAHVVASTEQTLDPRSPSSSSFSFSATSFIFSCGSQRGPQWRRSPCTT